MRRIASLMATLAVAMTVAIAGCSTSPDKNVAKKDPNQKPKTVVINKGMNKKQEENLSKRLDKLEKKVDSQDENGSQENASQLAESSQPEQPQAPQAEDQARAAAVAYYQAVEAQDWGYTYDHLDAQTQSAYTRQEWFAKNQGGANASPATFAVQFVGMDDASPNTLADVTVLVTGEDGSTSVRNTYFVYEDGIWKHRFGPEEYEILANAPSTSASASSSATASSSASASVSATATSSPSASPNPSPNNNANRNDNANRNNNAARPDAPGNARPSSDGGGQCSQGGHWVGIDGPGDGDSDGCAGE